MNKNIIVVGILVLLVLISVVQTFQIVEMKSSVTEMEVTGNSVQATTSSSTTSSSGSSGGVPTNLQNLPGMVGGCQLNN